MIVSYDKNPNLTIDQKLESLIENITLALNEKAEMADIEKIKKELAELQNS